MTTIRKPRDLGADDLVFSHFSLSMHHPIEDRISAAAAAGFAGIGLYIGDYKRLVDSGFGPEQLRECLDEAGICLAEIEVLSAWGSPSKAAHHAEFSAIAWELADMFEPRYLQTTGPYECSVAEAARAWGDVCDQAADHGLTVGLEFLPFTNVFDAADALTIAQEADRPNGGVCADIWHHVRSRNDLDLMKAIPAELITGIQMSDGPLAPQLEDLRDDCLVNRLPPGEGEFDVDGFVSWLLEAGVDLPWSLEVCNAEGWAGPAAEHAARCANGMRAALARARA